MKIKCLVTALAAISAITMLSCKGEARSEQTEEQKSTALVLYYSQYGSTEKVAQEIQRLTGADIEAIEVVELYDGDFQATVQRCLSEKEEGKLPEMKPLKADLSQYEVIYLGYPIWFGTYAPPITTLLNECSFEGKTIVPFCTFGSGGLEASVADLREAAPNACVKDGYGVREARIETMPSELDRFMKENGCIEGSVAALPEYSDMAQVTEREMKIFDEACGDYQFPLGTPYEYAWRMIDECMDIKFMVRAQSPDGTAATNEVYVIVENDAKPIFTKVVR